MGSTTINAETHNHTIHYNPLQQTHAVKCEQEEMTGWDIVSTLNSMTYVGCFRLYPHTSMLHRAHTTTTQWCDSVALIWRKCNPSGSTTTTGQGMEHSGSTSANTEYHMHLRLYIYNYMFACYGNGATLCTK